MHGLVQKILGTCERVANIFLHPGANYTYMYNLHTVCKSAHVNGPERDNFKNLELTNFVQTYILGIERSFVILCALA